MNLLQTQLIQLAQLNVERAPLQALLLEEAKRLFIIWKDLDSVRGENRRFLSAELVGDGVKIDYTTWFDGETDFDDVTLPIEAFLDSQWADKALAKLESRQKEARLAHEKQTETEERTQLAELLKKYPQ